MKIRTDVIRMYKEIHGWVGIVSGLALFIAFFAGAITMFEMPLQRWASPPIALAAPVSLERAPELIEKMIAAHPEAAKSYAVHVDMGPEQPARVTWTVRNRGGDDHTPPATYYAALAPDGQLQVAEQGPSPVAQFVDVLHQQVGLPLEHEWAMPIVGMIALLYTVAIVSGLIVLLPSLVSDLFALRVGRNVKRMWLDVHNVLGLFSIPFHLVMALTAIVFAFHDQFYDAQGVAFGSEQARPAVTAPVEENPVLTPLRVLQRVNEQAPGLKVHQIGYSTGRDGHRDIFVAGSDQRHIMRGPTYGMVALDAVTGEFESTDYLPGHQGGWAAAVTSFFSLHFGNFGGEPIRWTYFLMGLAGAFLFYTGNLLWVESRRKRERRSGLPEQTRATRILASLTVGVPLGCMAGIAVTIAAAKLLGAGATEGQHSAIYYVVFLGFTLWALARGAARASVSLIGACAVAMLTIPAATLLTLGSHPAAVPMVDAIAALLAIGLLLTLRPTARRVGTGPHDSVWAAQTAATHAVAPAE